MFNATRIIKDQSNLRNAMKKSSPLMMLTGIAIVAIIAYLLFSEYIFDQSKDANNLEAGKLALQSECSQECKALALTRLDEELATSKTEFEQLAVVGGEVEHKVKGVVSLSGTSDASDFVDNAIQEAKEEFRTWIRADSSDENLPLLVVESQTPDWITEVKILIRMSIIDERLRRTEAKFREQ